MPNEGDEKTMIGAAENILPWARAILETTPARWTQLTEMVPEELLARVPAPGEWSAVECLRHLLDVERNVFPPRVRAMLAGQDFPAFDPADREGDATMTAKDLAAAFAAAREDGLAVLAQVTEGDLDRTGRHSQLGVMSLREMLHAWAAHDLNHTVQAERAIMQPFIAGSGALAFRFVDHVAKASGA